MVRKSMALSDREIEMIRVRLQSEMERLGFEKRKDFAAFLGVKPQYLTMIFNGDRTGERKLKIFAQKLKKPIEWLLGRTVSIPLIAEISAGMPFQLQEAKLMEEVDISEVPGIEPRMAKNLYALRVKDNSFFPALSQNDVLVVNKSSDSPLSTGSRVIYKNGTGGYYLKFIEIREDSITLRCFHPTTPTVVIPITEAKKLQKVITIIPA